MKKFTVFFISTILIFYSFTTTVLASTVIKKTKIHQITSVMQTAQREGMITMEKSIENLVTTGVIGNAERKGK